MPDNGPPRYGPPRSRPVVDARQLWAGGVATAVVAALIALVGVVVCRWLFNIPILSPPENGAYGDAHTTGLMLGAAVAALAATGIAHLLLASVPRPMAFFSWIVALATLVVVVYPFSTTAPLAGKIATAAVDLVIGIAIGSLINGAGARSVRRPPPPPPGDGPYSPWGPAGQRDSSGSPGRGRGPGI
jgi:hypothetical protein